MPLIQNQLQIFSTEQLLLYGCPKEILINEIQNNQFSSKKNKRINSIPSITSSEELKSSKNGWKSKREIRLANFKADDNTKVITITKEEQMKLDLKKLLTKLTFDNYLTISSQIFSIFNQAHKQQQETEIKLLESLMNIFLDIIQLQGELYGKLYAQLAYQYILQHKSIDFKTILLNACQNVFVIITRKADKSFMDRKKLINTIFLASLYLYKDIVVTVIIEGCLDYFLQQMYEHYQQNDESNFVEAFCQLFTIVAKKLVQKNATKVEFYFKQIIQIKNKLKPRFRFQLDDLIDLRKNNWIDQRLIHQNKPQEIKQLRQNFINNLSTHEKKSDYHC